MSSPALNFLGAAVSIPFADMGDQAIVESWPPEGPTADVWFQCNWADRYTVVKYLRGGTIRSGNGKTISYLRPASYPDSPNMLCTAINEIRGIKPRVYQAGSFLPTGQSLPGWGYYELARVHAHFSVPTWDAVGQSPQDPSGLPMTTTRYSSRAEIFAPPTGSFYYAAGAYNTKPVAESSAAVVRSRVEIAMTRHMVPYPYLSDIMEWDGCVNDQTVTFADRTFPRGCLLFLGADMDPVADPTTGERCWDYTFNFMGNFNIEWNEFMDPAGVYVLINNSPAGTGDPPFEYIDYGALFGTTI
jgi:hypothetical protein